MKALYSRSVTGEGSRIDVSMLESTTSWLTVPITMTCCFEKKITRRGNTHEFFAPVSVYPTRDGYVYIADGNDKQFQAISNLSKFSSLRKEEYKKNSGRIKDVSNLNRLISEVTSALSSDALVEDMKSVGIAASKISSIREVVTDPLIKDKLLKAKDPRTGFELTLAPAPVTTAFLENSGGRLKFPPRFGEHNREIYQEKLGMTDEHMSKIKANGII
jgi:formyl-CoA transferase